MCLAVPGRIASISGAELARAGRVDFSGVVREVNLVCVPEAEVGDYVLVHAGLAISRIDAAEAARVFESLERLVEPAEEAADEPAEEAR